uniref:Major facilitator superfamily (MFS) profile domain-containing protein n=1 Tax=Clytia hemisphaerica TaxID=252671 RepID=A0A7M5VAH8_9CNID
MYVQVFEFVLPRHRAITSNLVQVSYAVAIYYLAFIAYLVRSWRATLLYTTLPCVLSILALGFYRSPRWLILKQQYREAAEVFQKLGKFNKRPIQVRFQADNDDSDEHKTKSSKTYTILDCFKHKQTLVIFFTILLIQYVSGVIYYTMYLEFNNIGGSTYLVIALAATADIPAMFLASYFPDKYGRKKSFIASLIIIGLCVAPIVFTPQNYAKVVLVRTAAAIAVKIFFSFSADVMMLWTLEIFPTAIRTQGFVMTTMGMSIGSATAPFVVEYVRTWAYVAPFIVIVALCFIGIVLSLLLPETLGVPAREKFEDFFTTVRVDAEKN